MKNPLKFNERASKIWVKAQNAPAIFKFLQNLHKSSSKSPKNSQISNVWGSNQKRRHIYVVCFVRWLSLKSVFYCHAWIFRVNCLFCNKYRSFWYWTRVFDPEYNKILVLYWNLINKRESQLISLFTALKILIFKK